MAAAKFVVGIAIGSPRADLRGAALLGRPRRDRRHLDGGAGVRQAGRRGTSLRPRQDREPVGARRHRDALCAGRRHPGRILQPPARRHAAADPVGDPVRRCCWSTSPSISGAPGRCIAPRATPRARRSPPTRCISPPTCSGSVAVIIGLALSGLGYCLGRRGGCDRRRRDDLDARPAARRAPPSKPCWTAPRRASPSRRPPRSAPCPAWSVSSGCASGWSGRRISSTPSCRCRARFPIDRVEAIKRAGAGGRHESARRCRPDLHRGAGRARQ